MNFLKVFFKFNRLILGIIFIGNVVLLFKFLIEKNERHKLNKEHIYRVSKAFKQETFRKDIFLYKKPLHRFTKFLKKYEDTLLSYHIQKDFKPVQKENGGYFMYRKTKEIFHFYNQKNMYVYVPEHLRDSVKYYFSLFKHGLITGFSLKNNGLQHSLNGKNSSITFRLKPPNNNFQNIILHEIYVNKKLSNIFKEGSIQEGILVKDTLFDTDKIYVIKAFISKKIKFINDKETL